MNRTRGASIVGLSLLALSAVAMLALHRTRPDLDPIRTPVSFYIRGRGAWLLVVSLLTSGLGVVAIAWSIARNTQRRAGAWLLALGGVGLVIDAIVPSDLWFPWERTMTVAGMIHASAAMVAVAVFPIGAMLITRDQRRLTGRRMMNRILDGVAYLFAATLGLAGAVTLVSIAFGRTPGFLGLVERILMTLAVAWLVAASRVPASGVSSPVL